MESMNIKLKASVRVEEFDTSFNEVKYLLYCENKRWQINKFLYLLILLLEDGKTTGELKIEISKKLNRDVTDEEIKDAIDGFLVNRGIIEGSEDKVRKTRHKRSDYLWFKIPLINSKIVEKFKFLKVMFSPYAVASVVVFSIISYLLGFTTVISNTGMGFGNLISINIFNYTGAILISLFAVLFHELGHMVALMKNDAVPGSIGFAFYYTTPVFYSDVSSAWELKRKQRVLVDVGGIYFQMVFLACICFIGVLINNKVLVLSFIIGFVFMSNNLNPFIKMDGYWIASDFLGIPNLHDMVRAFIEEKILIIFRTKPKISITKDIREREKKLFVIYVVCSVVYMCIFILGICKISVITFGKLFLVLEPDVLFGLNIEKIPSYIIDNIAVLVTAILLTKIIYTTLSKLFKAVISFLIKLKRYKNTQ